MLQEIPKKWIIKITSENKSILQKYTYCNQPLGYNYTINGYYGNTCLGDYEKQEDEVEITFEYFMRYIVNKESFITKKENLNYLITLFKKLGIK